MPPRAILQARMFPTRFPLQLLVVQRRTAFLAVVRRPTPFMRLYRTRPSHRQRPRLGERLTPDPRPVYHPRGQQSITPLNMDMGHSGRMG